ncbi:DUF2059 domain-containing protein [Sphingomonas japonica]|uniref:DUF2059 domain-containing protein n=1 Tax=Sphingomonas japonica TaxID=511662 RepID=A0ABX0U1E4_9SPHN|nr:DUF2059 domain-containing protein [Sphingomonas japonica]NIJ23920.1 hypothetical protein [Sphingomonas japonica]
MIAIVFALLFGASPVQQSVSDPQRLEKAREVVELSLPVDQREALFSSVVTAFIGNMVAGIADAEPEFREVLDTEPEVREAFNAFLERQRDLALDDIRATTPEYIQAFSSAYARAFSLKELTDIAAFLRTPSGARFAVASAGLLADPDVGAWQRQVTEMGQRRQAEEVGQLMKELAPIFERHKDTDSDS